ncbi:MAG: sigma-54-dependent Fis family transcriptional regulator [Candidatus Omnitrophica bacterium]|nr:sigma-54-dependent Fis family transcriptional regulator [Candidatus Omnitrophota bacterium]
MIAKILVVDDEKMLRERLKGLLELEEYEVFLAESGREALEVLRDKKPEIVVTDIRMPGMDGIELLDKIKALSADTEVIMLTGHGDMESVVFALRKGAFDYMPKPLNFDELCIAIQRALALSKQRQKLVGVEKLIAIAAQLETFLMDETVSQNPLLKAKIIEIKDQLTGLGNRS